MTCILLNLFCFYSYCTCIHDTVATCTQLHCIFLFVCHRNLNPVRKEKQLRNHVQLLLKCKVLLSVQTISDALCRHSHSHSFILWVGIRLCRYTQHLSHLHLGLTFFDCLHFSKWRCCR